MRQDTLATLNYRLKAGNIERAIGSLIDEFIELEAERFDYHKQERLYDMINDGLGYLCDNCLIEDYNMYITDQQIHICVKLLDEQELFNVKITSNFEVLT